jgi:hypothetical protein
MPYERLMSMHKIAGRFFFLVVLVHVGCIMGTMSEHKDLPGHKFGDSFDFNRVNATFGVLAFLFSIGLIATSIPSWRRNKFENFYWCAALRASERVKGSGRRGASEWKRAKESARASEEKRASERRGSCERANARH